MSLFSSTGCGPRSKRDLEINAGLCCRPGKLLHSRDEQEEKERAWQASLKMQKPNVKPEFTNLAPSITEASSALYLKHKSPEPFSQQPVFKKLSRSFLVAH